MAKKTEIISSQVDTMEEFGGTDMDTDLGTNENVLDLWLGEAEYYESVIS